MLIAGCLFLLCPGRFPNFKRLLESDTVFDSVSASETSLAYQLICEFPAINRLIVGLIMSLFAPPPMTDNGILQGKSGSGAQ
jgi:hypothetical protein